MRSTVVIVVGTILGVSLIVPATKRTAIKVMAPLDRIARIVLGVSLVLLALLLLAGRTVWAGGEDAAPAWAAPLGVVLLIACLASGAAGVFALQWRLRAQRAQQTQRVRHPWLKE